VTTTSYSLFSLHLSHVTKTNPSILVFKSPVRSGYFIQKWITVTVTGYPI
jgi:hypothetical protein